MGQSKTVIVVGAGIVGVSTALALQSRGYQVTVLDRTGVAAQASQGNAGAFAFAEVQPLASPGIMLKAPKWIMDPLGPLSIPPRYLVQIMPWMLRFWRASWKDRYEHSLKAQTALMDHCRAALERQIKQIDGEHLIQRAGQMGLFEGARQFKASQAAWDLKRDNGVVFDDLTSPEAIAEIQPGLDARFTHARFTPHWYSTIDPKSWTQFVADAFVTQGGAIKIADVQEIKPIPEGVSLIAGGEALQADRVVVACGAWSHHMARKLGHHIPLETERGYNTTLPEGAFDLRTHLTFGAHGFVMSRINGGVRVGGAVELGGLDLPPNYKRADILLKKAKSFAPGLNTEGGTQWMGFRPSLPDTLPVIDHAPGVPQVIYAFGHGHLGLTQSAGTAEIVCNLMDNTKAALDVAPYAATRF